MSIKIKNVQNNIKMITNSTTNTTTPANIVTDTMSDSKSALNTIQLLMPGWNEDSFKTIHEALSAMKFWIIIIAIGILIVIMLKMFNVCAKIYKKHNQIVIKKHNRTSPEM